MTTPMQDAGTSALVVGGRGGIGSALLRQWQSERRYDHLIASSRDASTPLSTGVPCLPLDFRDKGSLADFSVQLEGHLAGAELATVCVCTGVLHAAQVQPEKRMADLRAEAFAQVMQINALGPLLLLQGLIRFLPRERRSRLLFLSARVGSIADNRLGGWLSYRASKAALNQGVQTAAIELRRTHPHCVVSLYHPGTVDTALSHPFQRRVPAHKLFSADEAAARLSRVLHQREDPAEHLFVDWAGKPVSF